MLVRRVITCVNRQSMVSGQLRLTQPFNTTASTSNTSDEDKPERPPRKLKEWRKLPETQLTFLHLLDATGRKNKKFSVPRRQLKIAPIELLQWWKRQTVDFQKHNQRFLMQRHETLGCDLAAAHFLVHRGGKVKFYGQSDWIAQDEEGLYNLPNKYDPSWQLTHIDASNVPLYYEGVENFVNLKRVTWVSFKGNPKFDDWCMDKISANFPSIEHLDVSECKNLTERGLEALYRLVTLKTLIITDWHKVPSFELTCVMLEDYNRDLRVEMLEPPRDNKDVENEKLTKYN